MYQNRRRKSPVWDSCPAEVLETRRLLSSANECPAPTIRDLGGSVDVPNPHFDWFGPGAISYDVWINEGDQAFLVARNIRFDGRLSEIAESVGPRRLRDGEQYRIWVRSNFGDGSQSAWSAPIEFTKRPDVLRDPVEITDGVGEFATTPEVAWRVTGSRLIEQHDIYINRVGDRANPVYRTQVRRLGLSHRPQTPLPQGSYEVWVRTEFADGTKTRWGTPGALTVLGSIPEVSRSEYDVDSGTLNVDWTPVTGASGYELWVAPVSDVSNAVLNVSDLTGTTYSETVQLPDESY